MDSFCMHFRLDLQAVCGLITLYEKYLFVHVNTNYKKTPQGVPSIKQVLPAEKNKRSTSVLFVLLFTRLVLQGIVCYTF